jgi:long-chain acyl-CoA synthetase
VNEEHARAEGLKKWRILDHEFTVSGGELTPTLKVRRELVARRYQDEIEELYAA